MTSPTDIDTPSAFTKEKLYFELREDGLWFDADAEPATEEPDGSDDIDELFGGVVDMPGNGLGGYRFEAEEPVRVDNVTHEAMDTLVDKDVARLYIENNGSIQDAYRALKADGHISDNASRYFFVSFSNRHELAERQYAV